MSVVLVGAAVPVAVKVAVSVVGVGAAVPVVV